LARARRFEFTFGGEGSLADDYWFDSDKKAWSKEDRL